jgi:hypothetical protein
MTTKVFVASHARGAQFERGLRSFYEYRDLGIKAATEGRVDARVNPRALDRRIRQANARNANGRDSP